MSNDEQEYIDNYKLSLLTISISKNCLSLQNSDWASQLTYFLCLLLYLIYEDFFPFTDMHAWSST